MAKWFGKDPVTANTSTLRTVKPDVASDKKPAVIINVVKLIDETLPELVRESESTIMFYTKELERLNSYVTGSKELIVVSKKHQLTSISKPTDKK